MAIIGILTCEILELEFANLLGTDTDVSRITVLEDERSVRLMAALESIGTPHLHCIPDITAVSPTPGKQTEVLIRVLELGLHNRKQTLQEGLIQAALEFGPQVDALMLGYGLCGNALEKPDELLSGVGVPVFIPMEEDHPVDDCIGLLIGGRDCYYEEQCKVAGTFFMIPGWTYHWKRMFEQEFGNLSLDMAKRLFRNYERSLLISSPIMSLEEMRKNSEPFNERFGFRTEVREGTLGLLQKTWDMAKASVIAKTD
jgi:hypothetical protein